MIIGSAKDTEQINTTGAARINKTTGAFRKENHLFVIVQLLCGRNSTESVRSYGLREGYILPNTHNYAKFMQQHAFVEIP